MFNFRIINTEDGNQIIDRQLKTPENSLSPEDLIEYIEVDKRLAVMDRMKRKEKQEEKRRQKLVRNPIYRIACIVGLL